ncbi:hypothetical protein B0H11DRAFT_2232533 [Mycena galericulata]|nr:hypothetical protein B0H11DRAFT_2232533 [Mycena galericulata]
MPDGDSNTNKEGPGPASLQDKTNTAPAHDPVVAPDELAAKEKELEHLRGLVNGFTRGAVVVVNASGVAVSDAGDDQEQGTTTNKKPKAKVATDYVQYGRTIGRFLGPFVRLQEVVSYGIKMDSALSGDEEKPNPRLAEAWKILSQKFPGFHEYLLSLSTQPAVLRAIVRQMTSGAESVRQQDTATVKIGVPSWLHKDTTTALDPPLPSLKSKTHRGMAHPTFAQRLTPMKWPAVADTYKDIVAGTKKLTGSLLPGFIFPLDQVFPIGVELKDPVWLAVLGNACKGEILLRAAKAIFMGPDAALEGDGYHRGRPGNAKIIGMSTFSSRIISGVVTQVYFGLSSKQEWNKKDGLHFDYEQLFWTIYDLFNDDEDWAKEVIDLWNKIVLGQLKALRAAGKRAAPAPPSSPQAVTASFESSPAVSAPSPAAVSTTVV